MLLLLAARRCLVGGAAGRRSSPPDEATRHPTWPTRPHFCNEKTQLEVPPRTARSAARVPRYCVILRHAAGSRPPSFERAQFAGQNEEVVTNRKRARETEA